MGHAMRINQLKTQGTALRERGCVTAARSRSSWESKSYKMRESLCGCWRGGCWRGVSGHLSAFCLPTNHKYVGEELIWGEAESVNCVYACPVSGRRPRSTGKHLQPDSSADKNANFPFLIYQFQGDKPSVWQVLIYQGDTTGLWGQSQTKIVTIDC